MKKFLFFIVVFITALANAQGAVRDTKNTVDRQNAETEEKTVRARSATVPQGLTTRTSSTTTVNRQNINNSNKQITQRSSVPVAQKSVINSARTSIPRTSVRNSATTNTARSATQTIARAGTTYNLTSETFGLDYNTCRDAYFTCMDQFCAKQNDTYRRCVCSSKMADIQERERALSQASGSIEDFKSLNMEVIDKSAEEVQAMIKASEGETYASNFKDTSGSASQLSGISKVLADAKSQSLSTLGTLDIAGNINAIWSTTDFTSGANIADLVGEPLYNAVNAQCAKLVSESCPSDATLKMVISAYGMYIENDCSLIISQLDNKLYTANSVIRDTERQVNEARLETYNKHNSSSINDCIANVRKDITADTACGQDYVHCLDITGKYLNRQTGEPIYTPEFYKLASFISLSGDILTNKSNTLIVNELNRMKIYAEKSLDSCRDLSAQVWDEFMRQAITEIYQGQQEKVREVKNECLDVVNTCYDTQSQSLKDFSNVKEQLLLGARLELSEELCKEKLYTCSNLYGDPNGNGLELLISAMKDITDQKIAKNCFETLKEYTVEMCSVPTTDTLHSYPYGCRVYAPGDQKYATNLYCNQLLWDNSNQDTSILPNEPVLPTQGYVCPEKIQYTSCKQGFYLAVCGGGGCAYNSIPQANNYCLPCPANAYCEGGTKGPNEGEQTQVCGPDYVGSLYQKVVRYAMQACVRPSESNQNIPTGILGDVNMVMDELFAQMGKELSAECVRLGGEWVNSEWVDEEQNDTTCIENPDGSMTCPLPGIGGADGYHDLTNHILYKRFYDETNANPKWGYCAQPKQTTQETTPGS